MQRQQYLDYVHFSVALNNNLGAYVEVYAAHLSFIQDQVEDCVETLEKGAGILEEEHGIPREKVSRRTVYSNKEVSVPTYLRGLAFRLRGKLQAEVDQIGQGLRAIEIVWGEGEARSLVRTRSTRQSAPGMQSARELLEEARSQLSMRKRQPEPGPEMVEQTRQMVRLASGLQVLEQSS